jgi:hypothetical protein
MDEQIRFYVIVYSQNSEFCLVRILQPLYHPGGGQEGVGTTKRGWEGFCPPGFEKLKNFFS